MRVAKPQNFLGAGGAFQFICVHSFLFLRVIRRNGRNSCVSREIHSHSCVSIPACPWEGGREKGREKEKGREERKGREEEKGEGREERKGGKGEEGRRKEGRDSCRNSCIIISDGIK